MQKFRIQNKWDKNSNSFDRSQFELRETDGTISGKLSVSSKKGDKYISKAIPFTIFKSQVDQETIEAVLQSDGKLFEAEYNLAVESFADKETGKEISYVKVIINNAKREEGISNHSADKGNGYQPQDEVDDTTIPF
jgi:hypothetical protein